MLGVRAHGQHHVIAGGELLLLDIVGGRHLREAEVGLLVDQAHLWNRICTQRQNCRLAACQILRGLLVGDGRILLRVVLIDLNQLVADRAPQVGERLGAILELAVFRLRYQRGVEGRQRGLQCPRIGGTRFDRRDALRLEPLEQCDEFAPGLRRIVGVLAGSLPHVGVDDIAACVAGIRNGVQTLLGLVLRLHQALGDLHHARIKLIDDFVIGEVMEHARFGQHAVIDVAVDGDDVRFTVFHQARTQIGGCVGGIVDVDLDVGMGLLEFAGLRREPIRSLGFELEEIQRNGSRGAVAAAGEAGRNRNCACSGERTVCNPPDLAYTGCGIRFHSRLLATSLFAAIAASLPRRR